MNPHKNERYMITIKNNNNATIFYLFFVIL
jgi:hypothetical protein